jgi:hypothetical protein
MPLKAQPLFGQIRSLGFSVLALYYGLSALATGVALWRMRSWMRKALLCWIVAVLAMSVFLAVIWPLGPGGWVANVAMLLLVSLLLGGIWTYMTRLSRKAGGDLDK